MITHPSDDLANRSTIAFYQRLSAAKDETVKYGERQAVISLVHDDGRDLLIGMMGEIYGVNGGGASYLVRFGPPEHPISRMATMTAAELCAAPERPAAPKSNPFRASVFRIDGTIEHYPAG